MLILYHNSQEIVLDNTEYYIRELASGLDEVIFNISIWDPNYALMTEEDNIVDRGGQRYLIKQIDAGASTAKIICQLDVDDWKKTLSVGYNSGTKTVAQQIDAVKPAGWTVSDFSGSSIGRTIEGDLTPFGICEECRSTYKVYVRWDTKTKTCKIYSQTPGSPVGSFATRELNLKEINYKGKSNNFATRLYAYGKDGLSFASINSGKPYVDNNTYSSRVICAYWQDDRYTDKQSLLDDARSKIAKLAVPERSYDCAIVDLQATNPELYNNLDFSLFTVATLIDDIKNTAVNYQVVERHVWPYHPELNEVIFDNAPVKIQNSVIQIEDELVNTNSTFQQILQARIEMVTDWLTNSDSHVYIVESTDGGIKEFLFVNGDQPIETATQVMRLNASGLGFSKTGVNGPFVNAFVFDADKGGHLIADFITAGSMLANRIQGGTLESIDADHNYNLNLATGEMTVKKGSIKLGYVNTYLGVRRYNFNVANDGQLDIGWDSTNHRHRLSFNGSELKIYGSGIFSGDLSAAGGTFSGDLSAAGGTFSGNLSAAGGSFKGALTGGTIGIGGNDNDQFTVDANGNVTIKVGTLSLYADASAEGGYRFMVDQNGYMKATGATMKSATLNSCTLTGDDANITINDGSTQMVKIDKTGVAGGFLTVMDGTGNVYGRFSGGADGGNEIRVSQQSRFRTMGDCKVDKNLTVLQNITADSMTSNSCSLVASDQRLKKDIRRIVVDKAKAFIMGLKPKSYRYKKHDHLVHHGFIAQEVEKIASWDVVSENDNGYKGIRYEEIIADLVTVIQDQERRITALEGGKNGGS